MAGVEYVLGQRNKESHAWLEVGDFAIDITSDQFIDGLGPVYVGPVNAFHDSFIDQERCTPALSLALADVYFRMKKVLGGHRDT